ncbi:alpha/beta hydrolase family protein [Gordonia shandongensis]|uniref:alpha/beta hydrolase family protein n=1 Tax=Gordonia shandongensis TaxID=376351 RepID=UPI0003FFD848|nr:lipase family protein [Gordonia shandongensis]
MITPRRRFVRHLASAAAVTVVAAGGVTAAVAVADPAQEPTQRGGQTAGSVYANRPLTGPSLLPAASEGQQFSYWSQGADERMHLSTAVLLEPRGTAPRTGWPVVVWAHGSDGWNADCAPSQQRGRADRGTITRLLNRGYAVISPDYAAVGAPGAPQYSDVGATAHNIVDAVRASSDIGPALSDRWAVLGQSQGAAAAVELARKAVSWQTGSLDFRGAAAMSVPAGYDDVVTGLSPSSPSVPDPVMADVLYTLASQDREALEPILSRRGAALVDKARTLCSEALIKEIGGTTLAGLVTRPLSSQRSLAASLRTSLAIPTRGFNRPILLSQRLTDDTVVVPTTLQYITEAQVTDAKATMSTYLTPDSAAAQKQERAAVEKFLDTLF